MKRPRMRRALVLGFDYYGRYLARLINEHSDAWQLTYRSSSRVETMFAIAQARTVDAIISFGGPGPNAAIADIARHRNIPVIVIWAGTDVTAVARDPQLLEVIKNYGFVNISDGAWLVDELRALGIDAAYVPVTAVEAPAHLAPLPESLRVLTYLPEPRRAFYGEKAVYAIARALPNIPFVVVGNGRPNLAAPKNVAFAGQVDDMPARIDASSVLLRLPEHDGKSMLVLEALARGRHVIWNYDFPGVHQACGVTAAQRLLAAMDDAQRAGTLDLNRSASMYVARTFAPSQLATTFEQVLNGALRRRPQRDPSARHVAVSGLNLFTAQVARHLDERRIGWTADALRMRSRLEVMTAFLTLLRANAWYSIGSPIGDRWLHLVARALGKPRIIHWVGSDIMALRRNERLRRWCATASVRNLVEIEWTRDELLALGISSTVAPLPPRLSSVDVTPMPRRFTVLFYLPGTRGEFYGRREYERLIRAFMSRNVRFVCVGGGEFYAPPEADVHRMGWQTHMGGFYADSSVLVRFSARDGLSLMVLEALAHGRPVIWTQPFAHATSVSTYAELERAVRALLERHERGELSPNYDVARTIAHDYASERCIDRIASVWDEAVSHRSGQPFASVTS